MTGRAPPRPLARLALALVALAIALRIAVPAGFMPVVDAAGRVTLTLCSGAGPEPVPALMLHHAATMDQGAMDQGAMDRGAGGHHAAAMPHALPQDATAQRAAPASAPAPHDGGGVHDACPFGLLAVAADVAQPPAPVLPAFAPAASAPIVRLAATLRPGLGLAAPPPPKTGPPLSA